MNNIDLKYISPNKRIPIIGNFELTRKCPFNCVICYNERQNKMEMSLSEIKSYIKQLAEKGCMYINFTGGDPLIRDDFNEIYEFAIECGIKPSVETNGLLLNKEHVKMFKKYPPDKLHISVYALDDTVFKRTIQANYNADDVIKKLYMLKESKIDFRIRTPLSIFNIGEAHKIYELSKKLGVPYNPNVKIFWKQSGERCYKYRCSSKDIEPMIKIHPFYEQIFKQAKQLETNIIKRRDCFTGIYDFNLNAYGELNFCIVFWKPIYNLRKGSFSDAWDNWYNYYRKIEDNYCVAKYLFNCDGNCPWGYLYSKTFENCQLSINDRIKNKLNEYIRNGRTAEDLCTDLKIDKNSLNHFINS